MKFIHVMLLCVAYVGMSFSQDISTLSGAQHNPAAKTVGTLERTMKRISKKASVKGRKDQARAEHDRVRAMLSLSEQQNLDKKLEVAMEKKDAASINKLLSQGAMVLKQAARLAPVFSQQPAKPLAKLGAPRGMVFGALSQVPTSTMKIAAPSVQETAPVPTTLVLHAAVQGSSLGTTSKQEMTSTMRQILDYIDDIDAQDDQGRTALMLATNLKDYTAMDVIIEYGPNADIKDFSGLTPLLSALKNSDMTAAHKLIQCGANVNLADTSAQQTPLHYAVRIPLRSTIIELAEAGANPGLKDVQGKTPIDVARDKSFTDIVDYLQGYL
jgi:ankyrin repeat protein